MLTTLTLSLLVGTSSHLNHLLWFSTVKQFASKLLNDGLACGVTSRLWTRGA
jgi:hypothetical protein